MNGTRKPNARAILLEAIKLRPMSARDLAPLAYEPGEVPASAAGSLQGLLLQMRNEGAPIELRDGTYYHLKGAT